MIKASKEQLVQPVIMDIKELLDLLDQTVSKEVQVLMENKDSKEPLVLQENKDLKVPLDLPDLTVSRVQLA